ncbi:MAG: polyphosphate:AMP phosphotransferase, partial [Myxococcota bacterium]
MLETVTVGRTIEKDEYKVEQQRLRTELLKAQRAVQGSDFAAIIMVAGLDGSGRGDVVNLINEWMDTRDIHTVAFDAPTEEERQRPPFWRYWMALPSRGQISVFTGAWYGPLIEQRARGKLTEAEFDAELARGAAFEKLLTDEGTLIIKIWLHITKDEQKRRFNQLEKRKTTRWQVTKRDWSNHKRYDDFRAAAERAIRKTSTGEAPWILIEANDRRYRRIEAARQLVSAMQRHVDRPATNGGNPEAPIANPTTILDTLDLSRRLERDEYQARLESLQSRLVLLSREIAKANIGVTLVFEGSDAAGKGGAIRRIIGPLDARHYRVIRIAAPTDEEKAHHYLWRFWRHLPRLGRFTIYDRSWYGRVLVERVEGFAAEAAWRRAYMEINDFEEQLVDFGIVLCKFWLQISPDEQLRRFEERERTPWKQYKITSEDYRNREKTNRYERAAGELV